MTYISLYKRNAVRCEKIPIQIATSSHEKGQDLRTLFSRHGLPSKRARHGSIHTPEEANSCEMNAKEKFEANFQIPSVDGAEMASIGVTEDSGFSFVIPADKREAFKKIFVQKFEAYVSKKEAGRLLHENDFKNFPGAYYKDFMERHPNGAIGVLTLLYEAAEGCEMDAICYKDQSVISAGLMSPGQEMISFTCKAVVTGKLLDKTSFLQQVAGLNPGESMETSRLMIPDKQPDGRQETLHTLKQRDDYGRKQLGDIARVKTVSELVTKLSDSGVLDGDLSTDEADAVHILTEVDFSKSDNIMSERFGVCLKSGPETAIERLDWLLRLVIEQQVEPSSSNASITVDNRSGLWTAPLQVITSAAQHGALFGTSPVTVISSSEGSKAQGPAAKSELPKKPELMPKPHNAAVAARPVRVFIAGGHAFKSEKHLGVTRRLSQSLLEQTQHVLVTGGGTDGVMGEVYSQYIEHTATLVPRLSVKQGQEAVGRFHAISTPALLRAEGHGEPPMGVDYTDAKVIEPRLEGLLKADTHIILPGSLGTFQELVRAIIHNYKALQKGQPVKPIFVWNPDGMFNSVFSLLPASEQDLNLTVFNDPEALNEKVIAHLRTPN